MRPNKKITLFLYKRGNGIVPNHVGIYGSTYKTFYIQENFNLQASFDIKESQIKALDKPSQRCDASDEDLSVSKCVGRFIERNLNCSMRFLMSNSMQKTCKLNENLDMEYFEHIETLITHKINRQEEREMFEMTGCMPGCSKRKFELSMSKFQVPINTHREVEMRLKIPHGEYRLAEEYYLYDMDSFIPDVGGYLGLLLGYSLLSMYHMVTQWLVIAKQWLLNSRFKEMKRADNVLTIRE